MEGKGWKEGTEGRKDGWEEGKLWHDNVPN